MMFEGQLTAVGLFSEAYLHTSVLQGEPPHVLRPVSFDSIVIDEAAQASEPDVVLAATSASCRVIVVGDHKQLGWGTAGTGDISGANRDSLILSIHFNQNEDERSSSQCSHGESHHDFAFL